MIQANLCYLLVGNRILLGLKKRGFGENRWNGYGGKAEIGETPEQAVIREVKEEMNVDIDEKHLEKVAVIDFFFTNAPEGKSWDQTIFLQRRRGLSGPSSFLQERL